MSDGLHSRQVALTAERCLSLIDVDLPLVEHITSGSQPGSQRQPVVKCRIVGDVGAEALRILGLRSSIAVERIDQEPRVVLQELETSTAAVSKRLDVMARRGPLVGQGHQTTARKAVPPSIIGIVETDPAGLYIVVSKCSRQLEACQIGRAEQRQGPLAR